EGRPQPPVELHRVEGVARRARLGDPGVRAAAYDRGVSRWATFDCYGTLIDWNGGIRATLAHVFGGERADELLVRYHQLEPELEADGTLSYREVMTEAMRRLGAPVGQEGGLAESLPSWEPFPEVPAALETARSRGWRLAILSNTDRDFIDASMRQLGVP